MLLVLIAFRSVCYECECDVERAHFQTCMKCFEAEMYVNERRLHEEF